MIQHHDPVGEITVFQPKALIPARTQFAFHFQVLVPWFDGSGVDDYQIERIRTTAQLGRY